MAFRTSVWICHEGQRLWKIPRIGGEKPGRACQRAHSGRCPRSDAKKTDASGIFACFAWRFFQVSPAFTCGVWQCRMYPWRTCHQDAGFVSLKRIQVLWLWKELTWIGNQKFHCFTSCDLPTQNQSGFFLSRMMDSGRHRFLEGQTWTCEWETMNKKKRVCTSTLELGIKQITASFIFQGQKVTFYKNLIVLYHQSGKSLPGESGRSWTGRCLCDGSSYWSGQFSSFAYCLYRSLICLDLGIMTCTRIDLRRTASDYSTT